MWCSLCGRSFASMPKESDIQSEIDDLARIEREERTADREDAVEDAAQTEAIVRVLTHDTDGRTD